MNTAISEPLVERCERVLSEAYSTRTLIGLSGQPTDVFPTGMTKEAGDALMKLVADERAGGFLEIGLGLGLSSLFLSLGVLQHHKSFEGLSLDPFQASGWDSVGIETIRRAGLDRHVRVEQEYSEFALPRLCGAGARFDFIFVDGGHLFDNVFVDVFSSIRLARPGSLIVLDDRWMPAVRRAAAFFVNNLGLIDESTPQGTPGHRFVILRVPHTITQRKWDHHVEF